MGRRPVPHASLWLSSFYLYLEMENFRGHGKRQKRQPQETVSPSPRFVETLSREIISASWNPMSRADIWFPYSFSSALTATSQAKDLR